MSKLIDLTGRQFGRLTVIKRDTSAKRVKWICQCSCGNIKSIQSTHLISGASTSLRTEALEHLCIIGGKQSVRDVIIQAIVRIKTTAEEGLLCAKSGTIIKRLKNGRKQTVIPKNLNLTVSTTTEDIARIIADGSKALLIITTDE